MLPLLLTALSLAAPPDAAADWTFRDEAAHAGRSLLAFRPVELRGRPVAPLTVPDLPASGARFGLLPVGNVSAEYPPVVWAAEAAGGPRLWVAGNWHLLGPEPLAVPLSLAVRSGDEVRRVKRTVLFRRTGEGLSYAVRGFVIGRMRLGDRDYSALLSDGNGDGCFDAAGADRLWIDLDGDGAFDGLTEQFLLGPPLTIGNRRYLFKPDPLGTTVAIRERPSEQGHIRLTLPASVISGVSRFKAHLVSDWGELVTVTTADRPVPLPVGRYRLEELTLSLAAERGTTWSYRFAGSRRCAVTVTKDGEADLAVLDGLAVTVSAALRGEAARPGQEISVTPAVSTSAGLDLIDCRIHGPFDHAEGKMAEAEIQLAGPNGTADRTTSSFL